MDKCGALTITHGNFYCALNTNTYHKPNGNKGLSQSIDEELKK